MKKNFAMIGLGGYIAPRHLMAIHDTGNYLVAGLDKSDSVGIVDRYFPDMNFFTEFERFDRHIDKLRRKKSDGKVDFVSICSPNYLHDAHVRFAFRSGANAICEKPLVLNPWNIDALQEIEQKTGRIAYNILQLRLHPSIIELKKTVNSQAAHKHEVDLSYITPRGKWYLNSWKGDESKSGGVATNIGVHFFDMLQWIFGDLQSSEVHISNQKKTAGYLEFQRARVRWFLSVDPADLQSMGLGRAPYRSITVDGKELEFSDGFTDLHTESYRQILAGNGFSLKEARASIEMVYGIRNAIPSGLVGDFHPLLSSLEQVS